ncbi:MAG TPA: hypothetical protein PK357_02475 [Candidatus Pacearchaeota archaeon]|nr:hypothetical protein [Candidatus Pacearchaeota archaeon]
MQEILKIILGICVLALGIPIGNLLAKNTKEELKKGRKWFLILIFLCGIGAILNLIFKNDALLLTFLFIAIVTSMSLKGKSNKENKKKESLK